MSSTAPIDNDPAASPGRRPVGRPRVARSKAQSRIAILDAAETLFAKKGFDATPTSALAKKAKVTTGLVFYYFPTKDALLKALIDERSVLPQVAELLTAPGQAGDLHSALQYIGDELYGRIHDNRAMVRIITSEVPHHHFIQRHWEKMIETVIAHLTDYIVRVADGTLTRDRAAALARVFFSTIAFHAIFDPDHNRDKLIDELLGVC